MKIHIYPSKAYGNVKAPLSKSMAHRALICAALADRTKLPLFMEQAGFKSTQLSDDIKATVECLSALDTSNEHKENVILDCKESASTLRFLIPLALLSDRPVTFTGHGRLMERPLSVYEDICRLNGLKFDVHENICENKSSLTDLEKPNKMAADLEKPDSMASDLKKPDKNEETDRDCKKVLTVCGPLKAGKFVVPGDVSSQFVSGLLFALPLLELDSTLKVTGRVESASYIKMTIQVLRNFGITIEETDSATYRIPGNQVYINPRTNSNASCTDKNSIGTDTNTQPDDNHSTSLCSHYEIDGDYSNSAVLDAFNFLGGNVNISGLREDSLQGDKIYREYFDTLNSYYLSISNNGSDNKIISDSQNAENSQIMSDSLKMNDDQIDRDDKASLPHLDLSDCPDLAPILFVMAALKGGAVFENTRRLSLKESDRALSMKQELEKFGAVVTIEDNQVTVFGDRIHPCGQNLCGHNDHRIVMVLSVLCSVFGGTIDGIEAVNKSYPDFFEVLENLGIRMTI